MKIVFLPVELYEEVYKGPPPDFIVKGDERKSKSTQKVSI